MNATDNELYESLAYALRNLTTEELIKLIYLLTLEGLHTAGRKSKKKKEHER